MRRLLDRFADWLYPEDPAEKELLERMQAENDRVRECLRIAGLQTELYMNEEYSLELRLKARRLQLDCYRLSIDIRDS